MSPRRVRDYDQGYFASLTPAGLLTRAVGAILVLIVVIGGIGFLGGWFRAGTDVVSPGNVKSQYAFAYGYNESLAKAARQVCDMDELTKTPADPDVLAQRQTQLLTYKQVYYGIQSAYDARLENAFQAKYVKPKDVPDRAPTLEQEMVAVC